MIDWICSNHWWGWKGSLWVEFAVSDVRSVWGGWRNWYYMTLQLWLWFLNKTAVLASFSTWFLHYLHVRYLFVLLTCQQSSLPLHLYQWLSQRWQETASTWSAALGAAPTARWVMWWPGPASHLRAGKRSSNRRPPSRPSPLSSWMASTSVWGTRSDTGTAV